MNIIDLIHNSCRKHSERTAMLQKCAGTWEPTTYGQLWSASERIAAGLVKSGFKPGDHAALLAPSSPRWIIAYLGILKAGGVAVPVDKELKSSELRHILNDSDVKVIFTEQPYMDTVLEIKSNLPKVEKLVALYTSSQKSIYGTESTRSFDALIDGWNELVKTSRIPAEQIAKMEKLASAMHKTMLAAEGEKTAGSLIDNPFSPISLLKKNMVKEGSLITFERLEYESPLPPLARGVHDTAVLLYTSGTTGRSKGAMLSHANIVSNITTVTSHFGLNDSIHTLSFLPINHVFEQVCGILLPLSLGGKISFCESLKKLGENLNEVKPTFFLAVPAVYRLFYDRIMKNIESKSLSQFLFSMPLTRRIVTSKVKKAFGSGTVFISGGAALDPAVATGLTTLGFSIYQGYGITETSPVIAAESPTRRKPGTVGIPLKDVTVRIDSANSEGVGEIAVKGPNVMLGYYKNPAATAEVIENGWYKTGDLGKISSTGELTICGRVKNLIVTPNGKNVYPEEVEHELLQSEFIAEVMVYGHKTSATSEDVHAMIFPNQEAVDDHFKKSGKTPVEADVQGLIKQEVLKACNRLADYKRVKKFTLREDEFPKTTTRKIKRFEVEATVSMH